MQSLAEIIEWKKLLIVFAKESLCRLKNPSVNDLPKWRMKLMAIRIWNFHFRIARKYFRARPTLRTA